MGANEKSRGRNNTPSQRRFPSLRGRSSSRGRSATPTNRKDENTPKRNFKFKKLIPRSKSRTPSRGGLRAAPSPIRNSASGNGKKQDQKQKQKQQDQQQQQQQLQKTDTDVIVSPKQTRSGSDHPVQETASVGERDAPEGSSSSATESFTRTSKKIHNASERDGFCRRVDYYDGQTINVDGIATYEVGNYLGGGVAGVVYEGQRLCPLDEYPIRSSYQEMLGTRNFQKKKSSNSLISPEDKNELLERVMLQNSMSQDQMGGCHGIFCGPSNSDLNDEDHDLKLTRSSPQSKMESKMDNLVEGKEELTDEAVAIKILNPVGYRLLSPAACASAVVVQKGEELEADVKSGKKPMKEKHVWWLVNPSSKNLRTLQRNPSPILGKDVEKIGLNQSDLYNRGSRDQGIRLSLVAAYMDPKTQNIRELPLTRCIEVWGHAPFGTTEEEFESMMDAIERVNHGQPNEEGEELSLGQGASKESGLFRAATAQKTTVHSKQLNAFITVPAVPPKYIRWLRQRRAATKEIRNMMRIGRHKNVVHLFEVMELIQDSKSTMFLVLELVKGGELFDLISTNSATTTTPNDSLSHLSESEQNESIMLNFFKELASGIAYCHANGIAHRDLKPENLLVHNEPNGNRTLKIADFGLSSTFALTQGDRQYSSQAGGFHCGALTPNSKPPPSPVTGFSPLLTHKLSSAISFLTCGGMEQITECFGSFSDDVRSDPTALNRMTSIVGSPHYVAPEIISQTDEKKPTSNASVEARGYDGTKADVWSAGVILYAMLFKSLPFGEDLLRCPRYQSFTKWYKETRNVKNGRRVSAISALRPIDIVKDADDLGPQWFFPSKTSQESKDIIVAMLNPIPAHRLDIQQVLMHPWMSLKIQ